MAKTPERSSSDASGCGSIDYRSLYEGYWSRDDRWGSHSFQDADTIANDVLRTCGGGSVLDAGCGMGLLVRTMLRYGVDARGIDVAAAPIEEANRLAPGRFDVGSMLELPYPDGHVQTVISTDVLEHIAESDLDQALGELWRVCRRYCFVRLSTAADRDGRWHLTVRDRDWWLERFFRAGFRRHPLFPSVVGYERIDTEGWQVTLIFEKVGSARACPSNNQHGIFGLDFSTSTGDQGERAMAASTLAATMIRRGDVVLDATRGSGVSGWMLASAGEPARVTSIVEKACLGWATRSLGGTGLRFGDDTELPRGPFGMVADLAEAGDPDRIRQRIDELYPLLEPGGRLVLAISGALISDAIAAGGTRMLVDTVFAIGPHDGSRKIRRIDPDRPDGQVTSALLVLVRDPVCGSDGAYVERVYPDHLETPGFHVASFERDLDNPWLLRSMISVGLRGSNPSLNAEIAQHALEEARPGSSDAGAAICVLAYRLLDSVSLDPAQTDDLLARIEEYHAHADETPYAWRWRISNQYASALLLVATGRLREAKAAFERCASMDPLPFSPLLASKAIDSRFRAGLIDACAGDLGGAREQWGLGLVELERAVKADWLNVWGSSDKPLAFAMPDLAIMVELAARCASGLGAIDSWQDRPGLAWRETNRQTFSEMRRLVERANRSQGWLSDQAAWFRQLSDQRQDTIQDLQDRQHASTQSIQDMRSRIENLLAHAQRQSTGMDHLRTTIERLKKSEEFFRSQTQSKAKRIAELGEAIAILQEGKTWMGGQLEHLKDHSSTRESGLREAVTRLELAYERAQAGCAFWKQRSDESRAQQDRQSLRVDELLARLEGLVAERDKATAWWRARYEKALAGAAFERAQSEAHRQQVETIVASRDKLIALWKARAKDARGRDDGG